MDGTARPWNRRVRNALAWLGAGLLVGALALAVVTVVVTWGQYEDGLLEEVDGWWMFSVIIASLVLYFGIRWGPPAFSLVADDEYEWSYLFWISLFSLVGPILVYVGFPGHSFATTADGAREYDPSPAAASMWLVVCMVALGCLLMLPSARPPRLRPFRVSLSFATAGVLAVVLVTGLVSMVAFPREPHTVAGEMGEPASVPESVSRVGWSWSPPLGVGVEEVRAGTHGPLVLLEDGVVSLDGPTGEELWSFRRPRDWDRNVWVDDEHVYVRYAQGDPPPEEETETDAGPVERTTVVLDIATGEVLDEFTALEPDEGRLVAVTPEARIERFVTYPGGEVVLRGSSLDGDGKLWSRTLVTPGEGQMCRHDDPRRYGNLLVTLHGCASGLWEERGYVPFRDVFLLQQDPVEATVTAVDVTTGEEAWRHEWVTEPEEWPADLVGGHSPVGDGTPVIALERWDGDPELLLLDAATGERLDHLPDFMLDEDGTRSEDYGGVVRIDTEGSVVHEIPGYGALIHRADASGEITATADLGDINAETAVDDIVALEDMALIPRMRDPYDLEDQQTKVAVAPFGETVTWDTVQWLDPDGRFLVDMLAVPGAVVVHTDGDYEEPLVEGLVP
ncbi:outer membrane protein assembly factor BamB family protein [Nocardiopsis halotolerans]|uniref:outer membrane protein assembly factor BamB family protein n=1 Tax=Nocardiopsis halotolerans TaxID=124252 RepID=UPI000344FA03|nr:PQQ-binding-like beta-propeller repeat protein [Nocardiopsis halotolerans]